MKLRKLEKLLLNINEAYYNGIYIDGSLSDDGDVYGTIYDEESGITLVEYYTDNGDLIIDIQEWDNRIAEMVEASGI